MKHTVIYVIDDGSWVEKEVNRISPDRLKASCPKGSKFVVRFGPRSKVWEVYSIRRYVTAPSFGQFYKAPPPSVTTEHRGVAISYAILSQP